MRKKTKDPALPYFTRLYKRHKIMIKEVAKARKQKEAQTVRVLIEEAHSQFVIK